MNTSCNKEDKNYRSMQSNLCRIVSKHYHTFFKKENLMSLFADYLIKRNRL